MAKKKDNQTPGSFPEKWYKVVTALPEFKDTADAASIDDLKKIIVESEGNIYTIEQDKGNNSKLLAAQELVKEFKTPYQDAIKAQTAKIKYALYLLENKGVDLDNKE